MFQRRMVVRAASSGSRQRLALLWTAALPLAVGLLLTNTARAQTTPDLSSLSIEDLMNISVTSVSRVEEKFLDSGEVGPATTSIRRFSTPGGYGGWLDGNSR